MGSYSRYPLTEGDAESRAERAESCLRAAFRTSPVAMGITRLDDGRFLDVNQAMERLLDLNQEDIIGRTSLALGFWGSLAIRQVWQNELVRKGFLPDYPLTFKRGDGSARYGELSASLFTLDDDVHVFISISDTTEHRQTQFELKVLLQAIGQTSIAIFITDEYGNIKYANPFFSKLTGYELEEVIGKNPRFLKSGHVPESEYKKLWHTVLSGTDYCGEFVNRRKDGSVYWANAVISPVKSDDGKITHFIGIQSDVTDRKTVEEKLQYQASYDQLTNLPNRSSAFDRLEMAIRNAAQKGMGVGVLFIDFDKFKAINDTFGHDTGDGFLREAAKRIVAASRSEDTVARLSGDEFLVVLSSIHAMENAQRVAQRILQQMSSPFLLGGQEIFISASVGIATFPEHGDAAELLVRRADLAMYAAKNGGRGTSRMFAQEMEDGSNPTDVGPDVSRSAAI